jgi:hypothetical protein
MDEIEELLELARKTDPRSWCILTLAFNHGLRVSECAGGAPSIPGKNRPAIPPLMLSDIVRAGPPPCVLLILLLISTDLRVLYPHWNLGVGEK